MRYLLLQKLIYSLPHDGNSKTCKYTLLFSHSHLFENFSCHNALMFFFFLSTLFLFFLRLCIINREHTVREKKFTVSSFSTCPELHHVVSPLWIGNQTEYKEIKDKLSDKTVSFRATVLFYVQINVLRCNHDPIDESAIFWSLLTWECRWSNHLEV